MLQCRIDRWNLGNGSDETPGDSGNDCVGDASDWLTVRDRSRGILSVRLGPQAEYRLVCFVPFEKEPRELCGSVDTANQDPGGERIQRSRMTGFSGSENLFDSGYHLCRRQPLGLVNDHDPV